jgi:hypothetical protein
MCPLAAECESECEEVRCLNMNMNVNFRLASGGECRRLKRLLNRAKVVTRFQN